jgi:hypothetical protein
LRGFLLSRVLNKVVQVETKDPELEKFDHKAILLIDELLISAEYEDAVLSVRVPRHTLLPLARPKAYHSR